MAFESLGDFAGSDCELCATIDVSSLAEARLPIWSRVVVVTRRMRSPAEGNVTLFSFTPTIPAALRGAPSGRGL